MKKFLILFLCSFLFGQSNQGIRSLNGSLNNSQKIQVSYDDTASYFRWTMSNGVHTLYIPYNLNPTVDTGGISSLNGLTNSTQTLLFDSTTNNAGWLSASTSHTLRLPFARMKDTSWSNSVSKITATPPLTATKIAKDYHLAFSPSSGSSFDTTRLAYLDKSQTLTGINTFLDTTKFRNVEIVGRLYAYDSIGYPSHEIHGEVKLFGAGGYGAGLEFWNASGTTRYGGIMGGGNTEFFVDNGYTQSWVVSGTTVMSTTVNGNLLINKFTDNGSDLQVGEGITTDTLTAYKTVAIGTPSAINGDLRFYNNSNDYFASITAPSLSANDTFYLPNIGGVGGKTLATINGGQTFSSAVWQGTSIDTAYTNAVSKINSVTGLRFTKIAKDYYPTLDSIYIGGLTRATTATWHSGLGAWSLGNITTGTIGAGSNAITTTGAGSFGAISGTTGTFSGDVAVNGDDITSDGDLTITPAGGETFINSNTSLGTSSTISGARVGIKNNAVNANATVWQNSRGTEIAKVDSNGALYITNTSATTSANITGGASGTHILEVARTTSGQANNWSFSISSIYTNKIGSLLLRPNVVASDFGVSGALSASVPQITLKGGSGNFIVGDTVSPNSRFKIKNNAVNANATVWQNSSGTEIAKVDSNGAFTSSGLSDFGTNGGNATIGVGDSVQVTVTGLTTATGIATVCYKRGITASATADTIASYNITAANTLTLFGKYGWTVSYGILKK